MTLAMTFRSSQGVAMFFKNLQLFRLPAPWGMTIEQLADQLARGHFVKCGSFAAMSRGWVAPRDDGALVHSINGQWLVALCVEKRLLPASVINRETKERATALEQSQGFAPGRKQMRELKERVAEELLPRAFTSQRTTFVWIDPQAGWMAVNSATYGKAEEVVEHLRVCLDDFPLQLVSTQLSPTSAMADWLAGGEAPEGFTIDQDCELKAVGEGNATVRYMHHTLDGDEPREHLASGKLPTRLALTWDDRLSFVLTEKLDIKRMAFLDILKEQADADAETADDQFDADFALMTGELARFLPQLVNALGGEVKDHQP